MGLVEVERLKAEYDVEVRFAPYLLDPSTPPEGKPRKAMTNPGDPPSNLELRGQSLGITFSRGRTHTSNSHLALEAAEWAAETPQAWDFHRAMFKAYFEDLADIGNRDVVLEIARNTGLDAGALAASLEAGEYRQQVDDGIEWSRSIGVTGVPTFVLDEQYGIVGAQDYAVFQSAMEQLGLKPKSAP